MEADFFNPFIKDGKITLVLEKNHADFQLAQDVAELINSQLGFQTRSGEMARALNQQNIEVIIPAAIPRAAGVVRRRSCSACRCSSRRRLPAW